VLTSDRAVHGGVSAMVASPVWPSRLDHRRLLRVEQMVAIRRSAVWHGQALTVRNAAPTT